MAKKIIFTQEQLNELLSKYNSGISLRQLEKEFKCSRKTLSNILKENNVTIKDNTINSRKYNHDETFFDSIDTEHKAYWLGFMYADGFIEAKRKHGNQKFGISLNSIDIEHLEKFKTDLKSNNPIKIYKGSGYNSTGEFAKLLITCQRTVDNLKANGCMEQKTYNLKFPDIPKHLIRHFIRGYFDGDGCLSYYVKSKRYYEVSFVGTKDFLTSLMKHFGKELKLSTKDNITYQLKFGGNIQVKEILDYLYKDSTVYLDRKYEKYLDLLKYSES